MSRSHMTHRRLMSGLCLSLAGALCATAWLSAASSPSPVADAAMRDDLPAMKTLLRQGADVNAPQNDGLTALHWATLNGDLPMAQMLLYAGADVDATTRLGAVTALDIAAKDGRPALVAALLKGGANPKAIDAYGTTALMLAAASGNTSAVTALLNAGAPVNAREKVRHETALMFAAAYGRTDAIKVLLAHGADWRPTTKIFNWSKLPSSSPRFLHFGGTGGNRATPTSAGTGKPVAATRRAATRGAAARGGAGHGKAVHGKGKAHFNPFLKYPKLVGTQGGLTALLFAARQGYTGAVQALLRGGADINQVDPGDHTSPLLITIINGHFDLAEQMLAEGANPNLEQKNGVGSLFAVLNCVWAPKTLYPQPTAYKQQKTSYLKLMADLLAHGANPNVRLKEGVWYSNYNFDQSGIDETGATPFWRAAYADDVPAMKLLVAHGANPDIATVKPKGRPQTGTGGYGVAARKSKIDPSGLPPVPVGGPDITPLLAASGEGYGWSFTANHHRYAPTGMLAAVKYLVDVLHANVNARDADGNTALHNAASRGDNAMILFLVSRGADVHAVNRKGQTIADMANGPMQRTQPFPQTLALLEQLGAKIMHKCVSC